MQIPEELASLTVGQNCLLTIELDTQNVINMQGTARHIDNSQLGIECKKLDIESATILRTLLSFNAGELYSFLDS